MFSIYITWICPAIWATTTDVRILPVPSSCSLVDAMFICSFATLIKLASDWSKRRKSVNIFWGKRKVSPKSVWHIWQNPPTLQGHVMKKVGRISPAFQQLCFSHGVHLTVCDVIFSTELAYRYTESLRDILHPMKMKTGIFFCKVFMLKKNSQLADKTLDVLCFLRS